MNIKLEKGKAVVITGKQGSGKSTLARKIADENGSYAEVEPAAMISAFGLGQALQDGVDTIIIDGCDLNNKTEAKAVKNLIAEDTLMAEVKGKKAEIVPAPNFIFVTGSTDALKAGVDDRRYYVLEI